MTVLSSFAKPTLRGVGSASTPFAVRPALPSRSSLKLRMSKADEPKETSSGSDSYAKIEAPVRDSIPDQGPPVSERNWGQEELNPDLKSDKWNPDKKILGTEVGLVDSFRFAGAVPEVANSRLAMLGFVLAVLGEATTGLNVFQQVSKAPGKVASVFVLLTIATIVPVLRGVPRRGTEIFTPDAELVNGRVAMVAFFTLVLMTFYSGSYLGTVLSWFS